MGLFDELKKIVSGMMSVERVGFGDETNDGIKKTKIPEEYSSFPEFDGYTKDVDKKRTSKYIRCTMTFRHISQTQVDEYIEKIKNLGYVQGSKVRFDKNNTYIIVDYKKTFDELVLVFHIKDFS